MDIVWIDEGTTVREGYYDTEHVAQLTKVSTGWLWMVDRNPDLWGARSGEEADEETARRKAEAYWNDHLAISQAGGLKWHNPARDVWIAFSGRINVGSVYKVEPGSSFEVQFLNNPPTRHPGEHADEARRLVEQCWQAWMEAADVVRKGTGTANWQPSARAPNN